MSARRVSRVPLVLCLRLCHTVAHAAAAHAWRPHARVPCGPTQPNPLVCGRNPRDVTSRHKLHHTAPTPPDPTPRPHSPDAALPHRALPHTAPTPPYPTPPPPTPTHDPQLVSRVLRQRLPQLRRHLPRQPPRRRQHAQVRPAQHQAAWQRGVHHVVRLGGACKGREAEEGEGLSSPCFMRHCTCNYNHARRHLPTPPPPPGAARPAPPARLVNRSLVECVPRMHSTTQRSTWSATST